jgi:hypothetical protein
MSECPLRSINPPMNSLSLLKISFRNLLRINKLTKFSSSEVSAHPKLYSSDINKFIYDSNPTVKSANVRNAPKKRNFSQVFCKN